VDIALCKRQPDFLERALELRPETWPSDHDTPRHRYPA
jgi:hypothetical protein